jgi:hypothetical protein
MAAQGLTAVHGHRDCDDPVIAEVREHWSPCTPRSMTAALGG